MLSFSRNGSCSKLINTSQTREGHIASNCLNYRVYLAVAYLTTYFQMPSLFSGEWQDDCVKDELESMRKKAVVAYFMVPF